MEKQTIIVTPAEFELLQRTVHDALGRGLGEYDAALAGLQAIGRPVPERPTEIEVKVAWTGEPAAG